jgi:hypothetical protein
MLMPPPPPPRRGAMVSKMGRGPHGDRSLFVCRKTLMRATINGKTN